MLSSFLKIYFRYDCRRDKNKTWSISWGGRFSLRVSNKERHIAVTSEICSNSCWQTQLRRQPISAQRDGHPPNQRPEISEAIIYLLTGGWRPTAPDFRAIRCQIKSLISIRVLTNRVLVMPWWSSGRTTLAVLLHEEFLLISVVYRTKGMLSARREILAEQICKRNKRR